MKKLGITRGKCTGKSTLLQYIEDRGYYVLRMEDILNDIISSKKNISKLGKTKDIASLRRKIEVDLNTEESNATKHIAIPLILFSIKRRACSGALMGRACIFIELPFLYERHLEKHFDWILVVTCGPKTQEERISLLYENDSFPKKITDKQIPLSEKRKACDVVIDNNRDPSDMFFQMGSILAAEARYSLFFFLSLFSLILALFIPAFLFEGTQKHLFLVGVRVKVFSKLLFFSCVYKVIFWYYMMKELFIRGFIRIHDLLMVLFA